MLPAEKGFIIQAGLNKVILPEEFAFTYASPAVMLKIWKY